MVSTLSSLIKCCIFACLCSSFALALDDFDDGDHDQAWFISNGGKTYDLPVIEGGVYQEHEVYYVIVNANYKTGHAQDKNGTHYPHVHFCDDYDDIDYDVEGDDYWDYMFQEGVHTDRVAHATNVRNCFAYALDEFIGLGSYSCWINSTQAIPALDVDADPTEKSNVQPCDVLLYGPSHATGVMTVDNVAHKPDYIRWKFASSGVYEIQKTTFETPMCDDTTKTEGRPLGGNWDWDAGGDESALYPANKVWTADP